MNFLHLATTKIKRNNRHIAKRRTTHFCSVKCINTGRSHTEEWKLANAERCKGEGNPFYGKHHDQDALDLMSQKATAAWKRPDYRKFQHDRLITQTGEKNPFYGRQHSQKTRQQMSTTRTKGISEGRIVSGPRGRKGTYVSTKTDTVERYDSFFELMRMKLLDVDDEVTRWTKQHKIIIPYDWNGSKHYVPDFFIERSGVVTIEEIKGYEDADKLSAKMKALKEFCAEHKYEMSYIDFHMLDALVKHQFGESIAALRRKQ